MRFGLFYSLILTILLGFPSHDSGEINEENWQAVTMWEGGVKLERVIIGGAFSDHRGNEVLVLARDGRVVIIAGMATEWNARVIWQHSGGLVGAAIADLDKGHKGNEIFVGGYGGTIEMIYPDNLAHMTIFDKGVSIHGLAIGEVKKNAPGDELIAVDNSGQAFVIYKVGNNWDWEEIFRDSGRLRDAVVADFNLDHPGDEILVVGSSGNATLIWEESGNWKHKSIWKSTEGLGRVTYGKIGSDDEYFKVAIAGDSGEVILLERQKGGWKGKKIFQDDDQLRGIAVGDVYPMSEGNEIVTYGYSKRVNRMVSGKILWCGPIWIKHTALHAVSSIAVTPLKKLLPLDILKGPQKSHTYNQDESGIWDKQHIVVAPT
jgi:hypothetical protein